jgi:molecular chaperone GrpE
MTKERKITVTAKEEETEKSKSPSVESGSEESSPNAGEHPKGPEEETKEERGAQPSTEESRPVELTPAERISELEEKLLLNAADFENYKKRMARQFDQVIRTANDRLLSDLLEIVDNLERALEHARNGSESESLRQGMELIFSQLESLLGKNEVKAIEAVGKPFDPTYHEAMMQVDSEEYDEGVVAMEISKGYLLGDRVLRHSKVGVSKGQPDDQQE